MADLTRIAIERTAECMKARVATCLCGCGRPIDNLMAFLQDEREILWGWCPGGVSYRAATAKLRSGLSLCDC